MHFVDEAKVVNLHPPKDISAGAHSYAYVNLANYDKVAFIVQMGATGAIGSSIAVTLKEAVNTSGSSSAALTFPTYYSNKTAIGSASIANDQYSKHSTVSSSANFKLKASSNNCVYIVEVNGAALTPGKDCVGMNIQTTGAATLCGTLAILTNNRYKQATPPSAI